MNEAKIQFGSSVWVILAIVGPFVGSFLGTIVQRSVNLQSCLVDRSRCDYCSHKLAWFELIPVISWVALRRRCRRCKEPLLAFYPLIEIAAMMTVVWAGITGMPSWRLVGSSVLGWFLIALGLIDWRTRRLPDPITIGLFTAGTAFTALFAQEQLVERLIGAAGAFSALAAVAVLYRKLRGRDGLGFGDAKLVGALGMWVPWMELPVLLLLASLLGIAFVLAKALVGRSLTLAEQIPFGPFLAVAGWIVWLYEPVERLPALLP